MIKVQKSVLFRALRAVSLFTSRDETRFHLCGVLFECSGDGVQLVATDGHTMGVARLSGAEWKSGPDYNRPPTFILSAEGIDSLMELKPRRGDTVDPVLELTVEDGRLWIGSRSFALVDADFPRWRLVMPERVSKLSSDRTSAIGINPLYLMRVGESCKLFAGGVRAMDFPMLTISNPPGDLDPLRLDYSHESTGDLTIVIMPMRLGL